ncbi:MAG: DHH family phosphoesterase [Candidatus Micrarchaeia archaeon]
MLEKNKGILTSVKYEENPSDDLCTIVSSHVLYRKRNGDKVEVGDLVEVSDSGMVTVDSGAGVVQIYEEMMAKMLESIYSSKNIRALKKRYSGTVLSAAVAMLRPLDAAARVFLKALLSGAPIVVRFHNDGDGASGATALYKAAMHISEILGIEPVISWRMNRSIAYTIEDFYFDRIFFEGCKSVEKPIVLIIDFGTNQESESGITQARDACDIIMLDHHMPYVGFESVKPAHYINPWDFGGDSNFTAGALASVFAELISGLELSVFEKASFISDFSSFADFTVGSLAEKIAVVLDYLTSTKPSGKGVSPSRIDSIISSSEELESVYTHAKNLMSEAIDAGLRAVKTHNVGSITVHVVDFKHISSPDNDYPLPGRFSSAMQRKFETLNGPNTITIVHYGNFASIRLSKEIGPSINILAKINRLRVETGGAVSGGGHMEAASIKASEAGMERVLARLLDLIGEEA